MFLFNVQQSNEVGFLIPSLWEKWKSRETGGKNSKISDKSVVSRPSDFQSRALGSVVRKRLLCDRPFSCNQV